MHPSEIIAAVTAFMLVVVTIGGGVILSKLDNHQQDAGKQDKLIYGILQETAQSQRLMTCIMSIQQEKREVEYRDPNSFCNQMARMK